MTIALRSKSHIDASGDYVDETEWTPYFGDPWTASPTRVALTGSFADAADPVIDCQDFDTMLLLVDYDRAGGDSMELRVMYGKDDDAAKLTVQEDREDNATTGQVRYETVSHLLSADFRGFIEVKRASRYMKLQVKGNGSLTTDAVAVGIVGHKRDR
jgi:hypothetical protein